MGRGEEIKKATQKEKESNQVKKGGSLWDVNKRPTSGSKKQKGFWKEASHFDFE